MNLSSVLRPARKILTTALVTVVTATGLVAVGPVQRERPDRLPGLLGERLRAAGPVLRERAAPGPPPRAALDGQLHRRRRGAVERLPGRARRVLPPVDDRLLNKCDAYYAGETLGRGAITPQTLVSMWMHSPPHRAVLMSRSPRRIGIGATPNARGEWVVAANFMRF